MPTNDLSPYERAARIYCENTGVNPDEQMPLETQPTVFSFSVPQFEPQWHVVARQLVELSQMLVAMRTAASGGEH